MKIIKLIIGLVFLFNSIAYSYQDTSNTLRTPLMTGERKETGRFKDAAAQLILNQIQEQDAGYEGFIARAYAAAKIGDYDQAYDLAMKGLIGEKHDDLTAYIYAVPGIFLFADKNDPIRKCLRAGCSRIIATQFGGKSVHIFAIDVKETLTRGIQGTLSDLLSEDDLKSFVFHWDDYKEVDGEKYSRYSLEFTYLGKKKEIVIYYRMDATKVIPPEIRQGYDVLYVVKNNPAYDTDRKIPDALLKRNRGFIITEGLQYAEFNIDRSPDITINRDYAVNIKAAGIILRALIAYYGSEAEKGARVNVLLDVIAKYDSASNQTGLHAALRDAFLNRALSEELGIKAAVSAELNGIKRADIQRSL